MANFFSSALGPGSDEQINLVKNRFALTGGFQKVIRTLVLKGREKVNN